MAENRHLQKQAHAQWIYAQRHGEAPTSGEYPTTCSECGLDFPKPDNRPWVTGDWTNHPSRIHAHHDDYAKPLEVRFLCWRCHHDLHMKERITSDPLYRRSYEDHLNGCIQPEQENYDELMMRED